MENRDESDMETGVFVDIEGYVGDKELPVIKGFGKPNSQSRTLMLVIGSYRVLI